MTWRIAVRHRTGLHYERPARASYNEVRMTPISADGQHTLQSRLETSPHTAPLRYVDYWGSLVHAFDVHVPHDDLVVTATSVVETSDGRPAADQADGVGWDDVARVRRDQLPELAMASRYVVHEDDVVELGGRLAADHSPLEAGRRAVEWTNGELRYERGVTVVGTTSAEARQLGGGVCQDFAHVALALLRATGLPARYVSGYLYPTGEGPLDEPVQAESHAWVEFWAGGWVAMDPSNLSPVAHRHVLVARGRDYADVRPLAGVYSGPPATALGVTVELTRLR